jgi:N-acyl-D-aspartate/D-glutamate deacylase
VTYDVLLGGVLAPGRRADINLIELERLGLHYPDRVEDLPGGAARLIQRSDGYVETMVLGQTVVADGELTDARSGGLIRGMPVAQLKATGGETGRLINHPRLYVLMVRAGGSRA